jgi:hypothetical protein
MNQIHQETVLEVREAYLVDVVRHLANGLSAAESWETIREKSSGFADAFLRFGPGMPFSATRWGPLQFVEFIAVGAVTPFVIASAAARLAASIRPRLARRLRRS